MSLGELFGAIVTTDAMAGATCDASWVRAMLHFEAALADAQAKVGLVPPGAADAISACCREELFDPSELGRAARLSGNPAVALVGQLRRHLPEDAARWAHFGATSQDVVDSAMMLVLSDAVDLLRADVSRLAAGAASLAQLYRSTPMAGRTLLQHAVPTTFGARAAGWLVAAVEAFGTLGAVRGRLAVQLGGAAGTLSDMSAHGGRSAVAFEVVETVAARLGLAVPVLPWHTDRTRVVAVADALVLTAGVAAKVATDVSLGMQTEVAELSEPAAPGRGGSSAMPHKRNPAMSASVLVAWQRARAEAGLVVAAMAQEQERSLAGWQAEPAAISALCRASGAAVSVAADMVEGLEVYPERMAAHLVASNLGTSTGEATVLVDRALAYYREATGRAGGGR